MAAFAGLFHIYIPRRIRAHEWIRLTMAGKADAKDGTISQDNDGYYRSQYLAKQRAEAQRAIDTNVTASGREQGQVQRKLERYHSEYNNLLCRFNIIEEQRERAAVAASVERAGDEGTSSGTLERRKARRVQQATSGMDAEQATVFEKLCDVANDVSELLDAYREVLFLCRQRISLIQERYQSTCHIYLRAARINDTGKVRPLAEHVIETSVESFNTRVAQYDFTRHLNQSSLAA